MHINKIEYKNFQRVQREYFIKNHKLDIFQMKYEKVIMKLFNKNISLNIISNIYIKYHLLISISIFIILTLLFF